MLFLVTACGGEARTAPPTYAAPPEGWSGYATAEECAPEGEHVRVHLVHRALSLWMTDAERERLDAVDLGGTRRAGVLRAIETSALDGLVRALAPLEFEALGLRDDAARLRALAPITDDASRAAAFREVDVIARLDEQRTQTRPDAIDRSLDHAIPEDEVYESPESLLAMLTAFDGFDRIQDEDDPGADEAMHCYELGEASSVESDVAERAIEAGAPRDAVVDASIALLERMALAARR